MTELATWKTDFVIFVTYVIVCRLKEICIVINFWYRTLLVLTVLSNNKKECITKHAKIEYKLVTCLCAVVSLPLHVFQQYYFRGGNLAQTKGKLSTLLSLTSWYHWAVM